MFRWTKLSITEGSAHTFNKDYTGADTNIITKPWQSSSLSEKLIPLLLPSEKAMVNIETVHTPHAPSARKSHLTEIERC